jgi:2-haloacid dehalogenase
VTPSRPRAVAFDVNETMFSLEPVGTALTELGLPPGSLQVWFARVLRDGFALAATGAYRPFRELGATTLAGLLREADIEPDGDAIRGVLGRFRQLPPYPDVEPALARLRDEDVTVVTLTNGHADTVQAMLEHAGLEGYVEATLSVDDVGIWKPRPEPYHHAAEHCGVPPEELALVAAHSWDVHGAARAGLTSGYVDRLEGVFIEGFDPPHVSGSTLVEVVDGLLDLAGQVGA